MNIFSSNSEQTLTAADTADARFSQVCADLKLTVKLHSVDNYTDVDNKEFTMYSIEVYSDTPTGRGGSISWILQRRYSQFFELKTRLEKLAGYTDATQGVKFPGKVFFNKTSPKVVEERKVALMNWANKLTAVESFATNYHVNSFLEAVDDNILSAGETLPAVVWKDVNDEDLDLSQLPKDQMIVVGAASYWTYQALTAFMDPCCEKAMQRYPDICHYNVGISEMRLVPAAVRNQVKPILAMMIKNAQKKLDVLTEKSGMPKGSNTLRFVFDFDGDNLKTLRVNDCDWTWRVWLVYNGQVLVSLRSSTPDATIEFAKAFDKVAAERNLEPRGSE